MLCVCASAHRRATNKCRGVDVKDVLDTTLNSMESMKDVYDEKLAENVRFISSEIAE